MVAVSTPEAFTITRPIPAPSDDWLVTDDRVEALWGPLIAPTSLLLLRLMDRDLRAATDGQIDYITSQVAERLGVQSKRAMDSLYRLRRFHLIEEDDLTTTYDRPVMIVRPGVPPIGPKQWRNLPASVRERFAAVDLST